MMKKVFAVLLAVLFCLMLASCGENPSTEEKGSQQGTEQKSEQTENLSREEESSVQEASSVQEESSVENIVSDEEMVGTWISKDGVSFSIKEDGTVINETNDFNISFFANEKYEKWTVKGNHFLFQEAAGSYLKFEIAKDNGQLVLKYLEMDGAFVAGYMVESMMTELVKQAEDE